MRGTVTPFYVRGNTARGPWNLLESSLMGLDLLYVVPSAPGAVQSAIMEVIAEEARAASYDIWLLHRPEDKQWLDGIIIPSRKAAFIHEGALPCEVEALPSHIRCVSVNLSPLWSAADPSSPNVNAATTATEQVKQCLTNAYSCFADALSVHDDWETIYIGAMNFEAANRLGDQYILRIYGDDSLPKEGRQDDRFLGAATPAGAADFVPQLTSGLKRYLIKGRAGSGKSTLLKRLAAAGLQRGFDVELYHCGFDPNSIDMIIVRELGVAVFDSTAPHEYFPDRASDEIIDMYAACIKPGTDEAFADELKVIQARYAAHMKEAIGHLAEAKRHRDAAEQTIAESVNKQELYNSAERWAAELLSNGANALRTATSEETI
jgi:hypothetical protein